ncbi:sterol carrier protein 2 [Coprinopsis sp. MPI-PUGE-AT-0042]|nr:sterol carrier protein 2 [Coprinopsis sp. MPI-PUGE-AT-0042]
MPGRRTFLVGGGCTAFIKDNRGHGAEASTKALLDAGVNYDESRGCLGWILLWRLYLCQRSLYNLGLTHIPIVNVNNNCSTGSSAFYQANNAVKYGQVECALALGFERMKPGSLGSNFPDRPSPILLFNQRTVLGKNHGPGAPRLFDNGAQEYFDKFGGGVEHLAKIASKNHKHSMNNPYSQFRDGWSEEQVLGAPKITRNLTKFMCSPTSDFVHKHKLENQAIEVGRSAMDVVLQHVESVSLTVSFAEAGIQSWRGQRPGRPSVELQDCFGSESLITLRCSAALKGDNTEAFTMAACVVNPSGRLEARGHPSWLQRAGMHSTHHEGVLLPTLVNPHTHNTLTPAVQLRDWAGQVQAPGLHNIGLGGAVVVALLRRPEFFKPGGPDASLKADVDKVKSKKESSSYVLAHAKL